MHLPSQAAKRAIRREREMLTTLSANLHPALHPFAAVRFFGDISGAIGWVGLNLPLTIATFHAWPRKHHKIRLDGWCA